MAFVLWLVFGIPLIIVGLGIVVAAFHLRALREAL
jgi:uncharacterized membrane protein HdeD (DUF308 family)